MHISFQTGYIAPVREIVELAKPKGIQVFVDGAHAFAHFPFTRDELGCDYYGTSLHKWLHAPIGTGFLYVRRDRIKSLWPLMAGGIEQEGDIRKYEEIGTHPAANHNAISVAVAFNRGIGAERKIARLRYLRRLSGPLLDRFDLRVGVGEMLPWDDGVFDRVFIMWLFEHVRDPIPIMREAHRVLRTGGTLSVIETDYDTYLSFPETEATKLVFRAFREHFVRFGQYQAGRKLGAWLATAGFDVVEHRAFPMHFSTAADHDGLRRHMEYTMGYMVPTFEALSELGFDFDQLHEGARQLSKLSERADGDFIHIVFRGTGRKA